jgi:Ras-related protein Rab-21
MNVLLNRYSTSVGAVHYHTSAKQNKGIEEMFLELTQRMMGRAREQEVEEAAELARTASTRRHIVVVDDEQLPPAKSCCGTSAT